jgi:uncharacterized protein YqeY
MSLLERINADIKTAMKAAAGSPDATFERDTLRVLSSDLKYKKIAQQAEITDENVIDVLNTMIKKRNESATLYVQGNRQELADKELREIKVLQKYLPAQLSDEELQKIVDQAVQELGIASPKEMGKIMGVLVPKLKGQAAPGRISEFIKKKFNS